MHYHKYYQHKHYYHKKHGFTLLELLISIVISSIIALGIGGVYLNVRNTQNSQMSVNEIRDSVFLAFERLEYVLKHANYKEYKIFKPTENIALSSSSVNIDGAFSSSSKDAVNKGESDEFTVQMTGTNISNEMIDCTGQAIPNNSADKMVTQRFYVKNNSLLCTVNINGAMQNPISLTDGIENMQIFYSVNSNDGCGVNTPSAINNNIWLTATEIQAGNRWGDVCAINLSLLFSSNTKQVLNKKESELLNNNIFDLRPNADANDDNAKNVKLSNMSNLIKNTRVIHKIIRLRN